MSSTTLICLFFFFNDTATTEIYTLSLHDALPISLAPYSPLSASVAIRGLFCQPLKMLVFGVWKAEIKNPGTLPEPDRKSTRLNSSHLVISYAVFCLKKKKNKLPYLRASVLQHSRH